MIANAALSTLTNNLLKRVAEFIYPNNPRNVKKVVRPVSYLYVSTQIIERKDKDGVVHKLIKGTSCKRNPPKLPSKRDIHRQSKEQ